MLTATSSFRTKADIVDLMNFNEGGKLIDTVILNIKTKGQIMDPFTYQSESDFL